MLNKIVVNINNNVINIPDYCMCKKASRESSGYGVMYVLIICD